VTNLSSICLTRPETAELTRAHTKRKQLQFLVKNGIRHYTDADGWPVVPRNAIDGSKDASKPVRAAWKSNKEAA
jgi:hypothetical protein